MATNILVKAAPGVEVPLDGAPRRYITDKTAVLVEDSAYYRRRLMDGDLVCVSPARAAKKDKEADHGQS